VPYPHMPSSGHPPAANPDQRFKYVCTGTETDTFNVPLPSARANTNYIAVVSLLFGSSSSQYLCNAPPTGYTTTQIQVIAGAAPAAGDVLGIVITDIA